MRQASHTAINGALKARWSCRGATRRWRRRGSKVILMPQAFGPYSDDAIRTAILCAVDNADLVMPRDSTSYRYLTEVTGQRDYIRQYPDFTNLIEGVIPGPVRAGESRCRDRAELSHDRQDRRSFQRQVSSIYDGMRQALA